METWGGVEYGTMVIIVIIIIGYDDGNGTIKMIMEIKFMMTMIWVDIISHDDQHHKFVSNYDDVLKAITLIMLIRLITNMMMMMTMGRDLGSSSYYDR